MSNDEPKSTDDQLTAIVAAALLLTGWTAMVNLLAGVTVVDTTPWIVAAAVSYGFLRARRTRC